MASDLPASARPASVVFYNDPRVRSIAYQVALCAVVVFLVYGAASNAIENLARARIASGFGFWDQTAGFDISQTLIEYSSRGSTYGRAFWVGLLNTLLVAGIGIVLATILGFIIGISRLSSNWLLAKAAGCYVELVRNLPLLLQLLFWYNAVLKTLPDIRDSFSIGGRVFLNNRGLFLPTPIFKHGFGGAEIALLIGIIGAIAYRIWARKQQERTGRQAPVLWVTLALVLGLPLAIFILSGAPLSFEFPQAGRFNITGGTEVLPEFVALLFGPISNKHQCSTDVNDPSGFLWIVFFFGPRCVGAIRSRILFKSSWSIELSVEPFAPVFFCVVASFVTCPIIFILCSSSFSRNCSSINRSSSCALRSATAISDWVFSRWI